MITLHVPRWAAILLLALVLVTAAGSWAWQRLSRPWGAQAVAFTPAQRDCGQQGALRYCVHRAVGGVNGDLLVHLHGRNLEPEVWNDPTYFTAQLQAQWQRAGQRPPTVLSLSYGPEWLLAPRGQAPDSGLLDRIGPDLAAIEARIGAPRRRLLMGESMGGLNSLLLGLAQPQSFAKVAALCPAIYRDSPFDPWSRIRDGLVRTGADPRTALSLWHLARRHVVDGDEWRHLSPLALIEGPTLAEARPSLYLSAGLYDRLGLFEGTETLAARARERGLPTEWHPLYGGHCAIDVASLAAFLLR